MGRIFLTDLANWLRDAGLNVTEQSGWQTRARGSGGYDVMPLCVMWHHTASPISWDGQPDVNYIQSGDSNSPLSNLYINRSGRVWVIAGGATNTNGSGGPMSFSRGTVPADGMNSRALGVEMGNNGVGEQWPQSQVDAMFVVNNVCNKRFGNRPDDLSSHQAWSPGRKIDPATARAVQGPWRPNGMTSADSWVLQDIRNEANRRANAAPLPPGPVPPPIEEDVNTMGMFVLDSAGMGSAMLTVRADGTNMMVGFNSQAERNAWAMVIPVVGLDDAAYKSWIDRAS